MKRIIVAIGLALLASLAAPRSAPAKDQPVVGYTAITASPESFYDDRFIKELEASGFYRQLWGK